MIIPILQIKYFLQIEEVRDIKVKIDERFIPSHNENIEYNKEYEETLTTKIKIIILRNLQNYILLDNSFIKFF